MSPEKSLVVGVIFFNQKKEDFENLVVSINLCQKKAKTLKGISLIVKWNSKPLFDVIDACANLDENLQVDVLQNTSNVGFGDAHNMMMSTAFKNGNDYYLCLNPDGFLHPEALENMIYFASSRSNVGLVEAVQFPREHPKPYDPFTGITPWCSGACLLIPRATYNAIGAFDANIFMYCEDIDLSWRVREMGLECYVCSSALFFHDVREKKSSLIRKMMYESARYLAHKWCAPEFQAEMENRLVLDSHYPDRAYFPAIKEVVKRKSHPHIQEWRQLLSFSIPRW